MQFKQIRKDYQREWYESEFIWNGKILKARVDMNYHTFLHYWDVRYYITYKENYATPSLKSCNNLKNKMNRTEIRKIAETYMKDATTEDVDKLDEFYKNKILE